MRPSEKLLSLLSINCYKTPPRAKSSARPQIENNIYLVREKIMKDYNLEEADMKNVFLVHFRTRRDKRAFGTLLDILKSLHVFEDYFISKHFCGFILLPEEWLGVTQPHEMIFDLLTIAGNIVPIVMSAQGIEDYIELMLGAVEDYEQNEEVR